MIIIKIQIEKGYKWYTFTVEVSKYIFSYKTRFTYNLILKSDISINEFIKLKTTRNYFNKSKHLVPSQRFKK